MSNIASLNKPEPCRLVARVAGTFVILTSVLVLAGWALNIPALKSGIPGLTAMNPGGTAVAFFLTGAGLWLLDAQARAPLRILGRLCAGAALLIGLARIAGYYWGWDGGPDQFLFRAKLDHEAVLLGHQNRMAPNTAAAFILTAAALLLLDARIWRIWLAQALALAVALIALLTIIGYTYSTMALAGVKEFIPMAVNTGLCFMFAAAGVLCLRPGHGLMKVMAGHGSAGIVVRRMIPLVIIVPALAGWVLCYARNRGALSEVMILSFFSLSNIVILTGLVWWTAVALGWQEKKLRDSELRYKLAVRGSNDGLWDWNLLDDQLYWSDRFKEMLEITDDGFRPHYNEFKKRLHPEDHDRITAQLESHTRTHAPYDAEFRMRTDGGKYIWVRARGASVWDEEGRTTRMSGAVTDITDWKRVEHELTESREQADRESRTKSEFLANMSHELRTPLNSILGLTRLLYEDESLDSEHRDMVGVAYRSADNLLDIVNDILDLSKVESGQLVLERINFAFQDVVDNVMETVLPLASEKGLRLVRNFAAENLPYFQGDPARLGRVMMNLIGNAIKYTDEGTVTVSIICRRESKDTTTVEFKVDDTGIGIPADRQHLIFGKFMQADSSITRRYGGTGLGLAITKQLIEKMGGRIGFESREGQGSRFWFNVPFATAETRPAAERGAFRRDKLVRLPPEQRKNAAAMNVLIAEDHLLNQIFMSKLLPRIGLEKFDIAENGQAALEALDKGGYDMILMDCHMPMLSGYDATREIRRKEKGTGRHIPIIAMTADAMMGTRERCLKAGMDEYVSKPINADEMRYVIGRWVTFGDEGADGKDGGKKPEGKPSPAKIDLSQIRQFAATEDETRRFVNVFLAESAGTMSILRQSRGAGTGDAWAEAAHKLKGGAAMLGAARLSDLCKQAQAMKSAAAAEREKLFAEIEAEYELVKKALADATRPGA